MKWPGWLFDNLGLKVFALVLALLLYLHVRTDRTDEETLYFPLEVRNLADSLALATSPPDQVGVLLRGTGKQLIRLRFLRPVMSIDLSGVAPGTYERPLVPGDVPLGGTSDVSVLGIRDPQSVR